jgi:hypothetical protein
VVVAPVVVLVVVAVPEVVPPFGPLIDPVVVEPVEVLLVTPLALVVPPLGPVTEPDSVAPVRVLVMVPCPLAVLPRALVAVPLVFAVLPLVETEPVAFPPRGPVTVCCACVEATALTKVRMSKLTFMRFMAIQLSSRGCESLLIEDDHWSATVCPGDVGVGRHAAVGDFDLQLAGIKRAGGGGGASRVINQRRNRGNSESVGRGPG